MTRLPLSRWWPRIQAWRGDYAWVECPTCREPFGLQERAATDHHYEYLPGGEDEQRMICPSCTDAGAGCQAHVLEGRTHPWCELVDVDAIWPAQDGQLPVDPPTVVTEPVSREDAFAVRAAYASRFLDVNHTAEDAVRLNQILNPQQPVGRHRADIEEDPQVSTEPADESDQSSGAEYGLVMPFVTLNSRGGPHDDQSYVAGWEMGALDMVLGEMPDSPLPATYNFTIRSDNRPQFELIAMKHGYNAIVAESGTEGWSYVELTKAEGL
jgi:hypothetical protein